MTESYIFDTSSIRHYFNNSGTLEEIEGRFEFFLPKEVYAELSGKISGKILTSLKSKIVSCSAPTGESKKIIQKIISTAKLKGGECAVIEFSVVQRVQNITVDDSDLSEHGMELKRRWGIEHFLLIEVLAKHRNELNDVFSQICGRIFEKYYAGLISEKCKRISEETKGRIIAAAEELNIDKMVVV